MKYNVTLYYVKQFELSVFADSPEEARQKAKEYIESKARVVEPDDEYLDDWYVKEVPITGFDNEEW